MITSIKNFTNSFTWPFERLPITKTNTETNAIGSVVIDYGGITQIDTTTIEIFNATAPMVPETQYTKTGINLFTGTEFLFDYTACTENGKVTFTLNWEFVTSEIPAITDGDFYTIEIKINDTIKILFIVKITDRAI